MRLFRRTEPFLQGHKVLYLHPSDDWYGADVVAFRSIITLHAAGLQTRVLLPSGSRSTTPYPLSARLRDVGISVEFIQLPVLRRNALTLSGLIRLAWQTLRLPFLLRESQSVGVVVNTSALSLCLPVLRLSARAPVVLHLHETLDVVERRLLAPLFKSAHRVITVSNAAKSKLPLLIERRSVVVENTVPAPAPPLPLPPDEPLRFLFVGRLTSRKGIVELIKVWVEMGEPQRVLTVIGGFPPHGTAADLPKDLGAARIEFLGEVEDASEHMDRYHVVIIPSLLPEGMPLVALEALARERPIVATRAGGLDDIMNEAIGWTLDADPSTWADVLRGIDAEEVRRRQSACRETYRARFSEAAFVQNYLTVLLGPGREGN